MSLSEAMQAIERATQRYAKRQLTWFRKEPGVHWFAGFGDDAEIAGGVLRHLEGRLAAATASRAHAGEGV